MQRFLTSAQMRAADKHTIEVLEVPSQELMKRAGEAVTSEVAACAGADEVITVVCGTGNNGGDGYVCAQKLWESGFKVCVYAFDGNLSEDCARARAAYMGEYTKEIGGDVIVDCIFGTGLTREVGGKYAEVIDAINSSGALIISADIPSGLSGDGGKALGIAVRADKTVAIAEYKTGFVLNDGFDCCGTIVRKDIGICPDESNFAEVYEDRDIASFFPVRPRNSHKGSFGTATLVCGSPRYVGSAVLSVSAALCSGCGYVKAVCADEVKAAIAPVCPQTVFSPQCDLSSAAIAIGMGCGQSAELYDRITDLLKTYEGTLIIDADGLNSLAKYGVDVLRDKACKVIITPHAKEFSRLSGIKVEDVLDDPVSCAREFSAEYDVITVLKGAGTVITDGERTVINARGCSALAKAGSGDMLAGFMCGSVARGLYPFDGAVCAAYVLGAAAELAAGEFTEYCVTAGGVLKKIPVAIRNITL